MRLQIITVASFVVCASLILSAAQRGQRGAAAPPHDPHDLSGVWLGRAITTGLNDPGPVYTPVGKAAADKNKPSFGARSAFFFLESSHKGRRFTSEPPKAAMTTV